MAVAKKESFDTWYGTAAEKATFASVARGDKFIETDTGLRYQYTGSAWIADSDSKPVPVINSMELYGATVAARPAASSVPMGAIFMAVNTQEVWQSNTTDWVVM